MKRLQPIRCSNAGTSEFQERVPWAPRVPRRAKLVQWAHGTAGSQQLLSVVAGHGEREWEALKVGFTDGRPRYVGLVASPRRAAAVRERLMGMGVSAEESARLRSLAGLDIGAETPEEIAVSILAQIVEDRRSADEAPVAPEEHAGAPAVGISLELPADDTPVDPICGMTVSPDSPYRVESGGRPTGSAAPAAPRLSPPRREGEGPPASAGTARRRRLHEAKRAVFPAFAAAYRSSDPAIQPRNARTCSSNVSSCFG